MTHPKARTEGLVSQEVGEDLIVYDRASNTSHTLNPTAALVFRSCDGTKSVVEIASLLPEGDDPSLREALVWAAISQLERAMLLEVVPVRDEMSRRDSLLRLAATVMLPLVLSVAAPSRAQVASGGALDAGAPDTQADAGVPRAGEGAAIGPIQPEFFDSPNADGVDGSGGTT
jgi:hypothetical protein